MVKCKSKILCLFVNTRSLIYISYGGLLMSLEGARENIETIKYGDRLYCLIKRI